MTVALGIVVSDGVVLASDSATTLLAPPDETGQTGVINVYAHANKVFNLRKSSPIGAYTYGAGSIGNLSIATLAKDLRSALESGKPFGPSPAWRFKPKEYSVEEVAIAARRFFYEDRYVPAYKAAATKPVFGFTIAGYSAGAEFPELWGIMVDQNGACPAPVPVRRQGETGINVSGEPEAFQRLVVGFGAGLGQALVDIGLSQEDVPKALQAIQSRLEVGVAPPAMPIQDVIDLAEFLVDMTIKFSAFKPGAPTVGGPIEVAAITKHEGFRWVRRKHYFDATLNPAP